MRMSDLKKLLSIKIIALMLAITCALPLSAFAFGKGGVNAADNTDFAKKSAQMVKDCAEESGNQPQNVSAASLLVLGKTGNLHYSFASVGAKEALLAPDGRFLLRFGSAPQMKEALEKLTADDDIIYAERNATVYTASAETGEGAADNWGVAAIEADIYSAKLSSCTEKVTVAVVDSGVAAIPAVEGRTVQGYDFVDNDADATNDISIDGHGTFLAGIIADCTVGTGVQIMPVRILASKTGDLVNAINGIYYAVDNGAKVINFSIGGELNDCSSLEDALSYAEKNGVTVVVSSGNTKKDAAGFCPAHKASAITVSALDKNLEFAHGYSNYGACIDVCAPGTDIEGYAPDGTPKIMSGTSMSAAFVSAGAALFCLEYPDSTPEQIQQAMKDSCADLGEEGFDIYYGYGIPQLSVIEGIKTVGVQSVEIDKTEITAEIGETVKVTATVKPVNATDKTVEWSSSDAAVATVDDFGNVTAKAQGIAVITVITRDGGFKAQVTVNVKAKPQEEEEKPEAVLTGISLKSEPTKKVYTYKTDEPLSLEGIEIEAVYSDGEKALVKDASQLKASGFDPKSVGRQTVTVEYGGFTVQYEVTVEYAWWQWIIRILLLGFIWY